MGLAEHFLLNPPLKRTEDSLFKLFGGVSLPDFFLDSFLYGHLDLVHCIAIILIRRFGSHRGIQVVNFQVLFLVFILLFQKLPIFVNKVLLGGIVGGFGVGAYALGPPTISLFIDLDTRKFVNKLLKIVVGHFLIQLILLDFHLGLIFQV